MRHLGPDKTPLPLGTAGGALICSLALYTLAAWIFNWWPLPARVRATCPATAVHYQVFVDPTASNKIAAGIKDNWKAQARRFAESLDSCDQASFWEITDGTSSSPEKDEPLVFPFLDPNTPGPDIPPIIAEIKAKRIAAENTIATLMGKKGAAKSDIVGMFNKLKPAAVGRNVLVVFSDGKESASRVILEDGSGTCVNPETVGTLVDEALKDQIPAEGAEGLDRFEAIKWVVPGDSGGLNCNARDNLRLFWQRLVARSSRSPHPPDLTFDTNVF
jgi:hypothetical protein